MRSVCLSEGTDFYVQIFVGSELVKVEPELKPDVNLPIPPQGVSKYAMETMLFTEGVEGGNVNGGDFVKASVDMASKMGVSLQLPSAFMMGLNAKLASAGKGKRTVSIAILPVGASVGPTAFDGNFIHGAFLAVGTAEASESQYATGTKIKIKGSEYNLVAFSLQEMKATLEDAGFGGAGNPAVAWCSEQDENFSISDFFKKYWKQDL